MVAFVNSFPKGTVVSRGLDLDLSGKVAKKTTLTRKRGRQAHIAWDHPIPPLAIAAYKICHPCSTADAAATAYKHINVAIVTRSHFGNAKPKFHVNCWPTISNLALTTEAVS